MKMFECRQLFLALLLLFAVGSRRALADDECPGKESQRENRLTDQDFGLSITPDDFLTSMMYPLGFNPFTPFRDYYRPWRHLASLTKDLGSTIKADKDTFQINLDVQHFAPDELTVKTSDGYIVVEGKHEEKKDEHGFVSRQFVRRYALPKGADPESVVSRLSSDGVLSVSVPRKIEEGKGERVVPITQTGPVRKESKEASEGVCDSDSCQKV